MSELTVRPGDTLIISYCRPLTQEESSRIKEQLAEQLPSVKVVLLDQVTGMAVVRDDDEFPYVTDEPNEAIDSWGPA